MHFLILCIHNKCSGKLKKKKRTTPSYTTEKTLDAGKIDLELWAAQKALPASLSAVPRSSPFPLGTIPSLCLAFWKLALTLPSTQVLGLPSPLGSILVTSLAFFPTPIQPHPAQLRNSELPTEVRVTWMPRPQRLRRRSPEEKQEPHGSL